MFRFFFFAVYRDDQVDPVDPNHSPEAKFHDFLGGPAPKVDYHATWYIEHTWAIIKKNWLFSGDGGFYYTTTQLYGELTMINHYKDPK